MRAIGTASLVGLTLIALAGCGGGGGHGGGFAPPTNGVTAQFIAAEGSGTIVLTVAREGGKSGAGSVNYSTSNGTGAAGIDYTSVSGTLTWADGDGADKQIIVPIINRNTIDADKTFNIALSNPQGVTMCDPSAGVITIYDPQPGQIQFTSANFTASEAQKQTVITVSRTGGQGVVGVSYATSDGSGVSGTNYTATSGTLTWADGEIGAKSFPVAIIDDGVSNGSKTVNLTLTSPTGGASLGATNKAVLTITDADNPGTLQFSANTYQASESDKTATIAVTRTGGTKGAASVTYATSNGTAVQPTNYLTATGTLNWADGEGGAKTFQVSIVDDNVADADKTVNLAISNPTGATLGTPSQAVLTILDADKPGTLQFSSQTFTGPENAGSFGIPIVVTRTGGSKGAIGVTFATSDGTAKAGTNYTAKSGSLNWADGDTAPKTFTVVPIDDNVADADKTVNLTLSNPTGSATLGNPSQAVLTIQDTDGPGKIQFAQAIFKANESDGTTVIVVTRTGTQGAVTVNYTITDGTATTPTDYTFGPQTAASGTLSWAAGDSTPRLLTINLVVVNDDTAPEADETVNFALTNPTGGATLGTQTTAVLQIADDDAPTGTPPSNTGCVHFK